MNNNLINWKSGWKDVGKSVSHPYCNYVTTYTGDQVFDKKARYKFSIQVTNHNSRHGSFIEAVIGLVHPNDASKGVWGVPEGSFRLMNWVGNSKTHIVTTGDIVDVFCDLTTKHGTIMMVNRKTKAIYYEKDGFQTPLVPVLSIWSQGGINIIDNDNNDQWIWDKIKREHAGAFEDVAVLTDIKQAISDKLQSLNEKDLSKLKDIPVNELLTLQQQIGGSQDEFKEIEQALDAIKQKLSSIEVKITEVITPDVAQYKSWTATDIVRYICLLEEGKFAALSDALLSSFTEQEINGQNVVNIEKNDLFTMGIKNFNDRTAIYNHLQALKQEE